MKTLSVVIPVYNSETTIGHLCSALMGLYAQTFRLEIILVNDGSTDSSDVVCRSLQRGHEDTITYLKLARNFGEHCAVMAGLNHATGDFCVVMDDDFQNPPSEVGKLVGEIQKGYDVVYAQYEVKRDAWHRNLGSWFNDKMAGFILNKPRGLYLSSFKVLNRFLVKEIIKHTEPEPYLDGIILRITDNVGRIQIAHAVRLAGKSGYTPAKLFALWGNMVMSYSMVPLRLIGLTGILLMVVGTLYGIVKAYDEIGSQARLSNYESLMFANTVFRGMVLFAFSIVGEYVGRIYLLFNRDPQFVVRERLSVKKKAADQIAYLRER